MKHRLALILFLVFTGSAFAQINPYEEWLTNEGCYLLTPEQKTKFQSLADTEKEFFIRNLWLSLDTDPMTPENEFQKEYQKRFEYVKKYFNIPSDRAKIYLLLGPPNSVNRHPNSDKYYPLELWSYYSLGYRNLPPSLDLIFFKRWGVGDYRLYSPLFDGFKALTPSGQDFENPRARAQLKAYFDADVVEAAEHISTGASQMESETVRATLQDPAAMERIMRKQRPTVETTVVYQGFDADVYTYSVPYEGQVFRTSIALAVPPKYLTFEKDEHEYRGRVDLLGRINDDQGKEIVKINDSPPLKITESDMEKVKTYFFSYLFDAYLLPGKYTLECVFRDYASNAAGKVEKNFEVKSTAGDWELLPPMLAFKSGPSTTEQSPFGYEWQQYYPKENSTFSNDQTLIVYTTLLNPKRIKLEGIWKLQMALVKNGANVLEVDEDVPLSSNSNVNLARKMKLQSLVPGSYLFSIQLSRAGTILTAETPVKIADSEVLGRMRIIPSSSLSPEGYHANLALQFYNRNELTEASRHVRIALDFAPSSYTVRSLSARIEKAKGNDEAAIAAYEKLVQESPADSEGFFLIGKWSLEKKDWKKASDMLKKAMSLGYYTTELLNDLARAEIQLGNTAEALGYWEKSLTLNDNQPEIRQQLSTVRNE